MLVDKTFLGRVVEVEYLMWFSEGGGVRKFEVQMFQGLCVEVSRRSRSLVLSRKIDGVWVFRRFFVNGPHILRFDLGF